MNPEQYKKMKDKFEKEKKTAQEAVITAEGKLSALEEVYKQSDSKYAKHKGRKYRKSKSEYAYVPSAQDVNKTGIMRDSLKHLGETFKTKNFMAYLKDKYPDIIFSDTFVSNTIGKFLKQGRIVIESKGEKKKGYVYRRK